MVVPEPRVGRPGAEHGQDAHLAPHPARDLPPLRLHRADVGRAVGHLAARATRAAAAEAEGLAGARRHRDRVGERVLGVHGAARGVPGDGGG